MLERTDNHSYYQNFHTNDPFFYKKIFKKFFVEITQKNDLKLHKNVKTENDPQCL